MTPIRVIVADDQIFAVEGLTHIVSEAEDMTVIGHAMTILEVLDLSDRMQPDVVVLDLAWPGDKTAGIKAIPQIKVKSPGTQIVAVTVYNELIDSARNAGAFPLGKGFSKIELLDTIRWAVQIKETPSNLLAVAPNDFENLTMRELDVIRLVAKGLTDRQIASQLFIAEGTVKKHVGSILGKLGANNRAEAAVLAERYQLI